MTLEGDHVFAILQDGSCDIPSANYEGLSAYCSIHVAGDFGKVLAEFKISFTSWETVAEERKMLKRLATSATKKLDELYDLKGA